MASALKYAVTLKNTMLDAITTAISTSGLLRIYSGTQPTNPDTALSGNTLLAELALSSTAAGAASSSVLTFSTITADSSADATGTAAFGSFLSSCGTRKVDFSVGTSGSDLNLNTVSIVAAANVAVTSAAITGAN